MTKAHARRKWAQYLRKVKPNHATLSLDLQANAHLSGCRVLEEKLISAALGVKIQTALMHASWTIGSRMQELAVCSQAAASAHFHDVASFIHTISEVPLPTVAVLDGVAVGGALGVGTHATACVVTERTRLCLPGPLHGFLSESFASQVLARLPVPGLGAYLMLTGASLTGPEMVEMGLATHTTESQTVPLLHDELSRQHHRAIGLTLRNLEMRCVELKRETYDQGHALFYRDEIAECFSQSTVSGILAKLEAGGTPWHLQAAQTLSLASPLMLVLTLELLQRSATLTTQSALQMEAVVCSNVVAKSSDFAQGTKHRQVRFCLR